MRNPLRKSLAHFFKLDVLGKIRFNGMYESKATQLTRSFLIGMEVSNDITINATYFLLVNTVQRPMANELV